MTAWHVPEVTAVPYWSPGLSGQAPKLPKERYMCMTLAHTIVGIFRTADNAHHHAVLNVVADAAKVDPAGNLHGMYDFSGLAARPLL